MPRRHRQGAALSSCCLVWRFFQQGNMNSKLLLGGAFLALSAPAIADPVFVHKFDGGDCLEATLDDQHAEYAKSFEGIALLGSAGLHEGRCPQSMWDAAKLKAQSFISAPFLGRKSSATPAVVTDAEEDGKVDLSAQSRRKVFKDAAAAALAAGVSLSNPLSANAITSDIRNQLSYEQVKGTGLANRCNEVQGKDSIKIGGGNYQLTSFCLEPKTWQVEEEVANKKGDVTKQFVNTKLMTRQTYTLDGISGSLSTSGGGITFKEEDGIDYAPTTVQLPAKKGDVTKQFVNTKLM